VGEVVLDQVEDLLLLLREPVKEVRERALRLGEELGWPAKQLREDDPLLFEVVLRIDCEADLGAVARPQVLPADRALSAAVVRALRRSAKSVS
jgi:hypothetical protein